MTAFAQALTGALLHFLWQGTMVGCILWVALRLLRKRSATARYGAACAALAIMALLPVGTIWLLYSGAPITVAPSTAVTVAATTVAAATATPVSWLSGVQDWALPLWCFGVLLVSLRLLWGARQVYALRRRAVAAEAAIANMAAAMSERLGVGRTVQVLISELAESPSVVGWVRPLILLPSATLLGLTREQLEVVLAHELAHIRRFDYAVNLGQMLLETLLFYHPAVWWASARIRDERELCCDDLAVRCCGDAVCYARALTRLERLRLSAPAMAMSSTGGPLLYRIQRLLGVSPEPRVSRWPGVLAAALAVACLMATVHWAHAQQQEGPGKVSLVVRRIPEEARGVTVDTGGAAILHRTGIEYPRTALEKGIRGTVVVEAVLDAGGNVEDARILSGPVELRKAALTSVLQWHFLGDTAGSTRQVSVSFAPTKESAIDVGLFLSEANELEQRERRIREELESRRKNVVSAPGGNIAVAVTRAEESGWTDRPAQVREGLERLANLERDIAERRKELGPNHPDVREMVREFERARMEYARDSRPMVGRTIKSIDVVGLSDALRERLMARIGVHLGDTVSEQMLERVGAAVKKFDEHFEFQVSPVGESEVEVWIAAPEGEGRVEVRVK